jgi:hypothetical protein
LGEVAEDRVERGVLEFRSAADLFGDRFDQFDVEALEFGLGLAEFLEGSVSPPPEPPVVLLSLLPQPAAKTAMAETARTASVAVSRELPIRSCLRFGEIGEGAAKLPLYLSRRKPVALPTPSYTF